MAPTPLATVADLEARMGRTVDDVGQAEARLVDASAAVRRYTRQTLSRVTDDVVTLRSDRLGRIYLPQRPADEPTVLVSTTTGVALTAAQWKWEDGYVQLGPWACVDRVRVTYSHGYAPDAMPDEIVAVVCQVADRIISSPAGGSGVASEQIDDYRYMLGGGLTSGTAGLVGEEKEMLDDYRSRPHTVRLR